LSDYRIDHLGIAVRSIDAALRFYGGVLGMEAARARPWPGKGERGHARLRRPAPGIARTCRRRLPIGRFLEKRGEGLHHVALLVDDLAGRSSG